MPALIEPGGEFSGALLAAVAVLQLFVAQQTNFAAADIAGLFIE